MYYFNPFMESYPEMVSLERKRPDDGFNFTPEEAFSKGNLIKSQYDPYRSYQPSMPMGKDEKENLSNYYGYGSVSGTLCLRRRNGCNHHRQ